MLLNIVQGTEKHLPPPQQRLNLPKMSIVPKLGKPGLESKDKKRQWNESGAD